MKIVKLLSVIVLLLLGNTGVAFTPFNSFPVFEDTEAGEEITEDSSDFSESILTTLISLQPSVTNPAAAIVNFQFHSANIAGEATKYITSSRFIVPGLGLKETLFPFHTFL